jgi:hypothetical protein
VVGSPRIGRRTMGAIVRSKLTAFVALVVCGGLVLAGVASAGVPFETDVTIKEENGDFHGMVKSATASCIVDRKVTVFKKRDGDDKKINSDTSDKDGKWNTGNTHVGPGKYYAKAKAVAPLKAPIHRGLECQKGKSKTITVN